MLLNAYPMRLSKGIWRSRKEEAIWIKVHVWWPYYVLVQQYIAYKQMETGSFMLGRRIAKIGRKKAMYAFCYLQ